MGGWSAGLTLDENGNVHVEIYGQDPEGNSRVIRISELGNINADGVFNPTNNTLPSSTGLIASLRDLSPSDITQIQRLTSVTNGIKRLLDISLHDEDGNAYSTTNPLPVRLSDGSVNIGTVNAELEVQLSHKDNTPNAGDVADSVQIGDGVTVAKIDPDNRSFSVNTYEKLLPVLANSNWMKLGNFDSIVPTFSANQAILDYYEDGAIIGKATFNFTTDTNWDIILERYINNPDGSILLDDNDAPLYLD